jgi:multisubunit Na+/H+ antiporter MnhB subunit
VFIRNAGIIFAVIEITMELQLLLLFMVFAAIVAVQIEDLLSSVIAVGAVGLGLSLAFLILKAPDLAITQLVVEILCLIILIRATINKDLPLIRDGRWLFNTISTLLFIGLFLLCAYFAFKDLPKFGQPIMRVAQEYIDKGLGKTGAANIVASIILDFRGYDTLGEATILFTAVMGVLAVIRKVGRINEE